MATTVLPPAIPRSASPRRAPWRSPADQPAYARPALLAICGLALLVYAWGIEHSQYHLFYANAARSMTDSWKAFLFGSFDPGSTITLDKLPGFLWPQALSARVLGFHPWALVLPQVLEGVASVLVLFRVVRRWSGPNAALIACAAFLVTPVAAGLFRTAVEDPAFTLCVLLAADATGRAAESGRLRSLLLAGVWVGVGFQAKMLEAWAVLPALALAHALAAPGKRLRRAGHLALAGLVTVAVSASWMLAATLTPAHDRPYIDGTTNDSAFSMVVGYNFLSRFSSLGISAASTGSINATQGGHGGHHGAFAGRPGPRGSGGLGGFSGHGRPGGAGGAGGFKAFGGQDGWSKMVEPTLASQTGWLYPFAAIALAAGLLWRRGRPRTDRLRAGFALWGVWLVTYVLVFSAGSVGGHTYYMGVVAVPLAALTGGGVAVMWRAYRDGGRRAWVLPGAVAATAAWSAYVCGEFASFAGWLVPVVLLLGVAAVVLLTLGRRGVRARRLASFGLLAGLAAVLVAPGAWASQVFNPSAGPTGMMGSVGPATPSHRTGAATPFWMSLSGSESLTAGESSLLAYTRAHQGSARYVFATLSWNAASPYILAANAPVLPIGGFTGKAPSPTLTRFERLVRGGELRYVQIPLAGGGSAGPGSAGVGAAGGGSAGVGAAGVGSAGGGSAGVGGGASGSAGGVGSVAAGGGAGSGDLGGAAAGGSAGFSGSDPAAAEGGAGYGDSGPAAAGGGAAFGNTRGAMPGTAAAAISTWVTRNCASLPSVPDLGATLYDCAPRH